MTLAFVTNSLHHHQLPVADEFFRLLGENYHYIATEALPERLKSKGYDASIERSYVIRAYESDERMSEARRIIDDSDVVIIGDAPKNWVLKRKNENRITFHCSERWLKKINLRTFHPLSLRKIFLNYWRYRHKHCYMLCAGSYTKKDVKMFRCFPNRCFKWGYFTRVDESFELEASKQDASSSESTPLMWCARFLSLKHPELPVQLAARLKEKGYKFTLDMFGSGEELEKTKSLAVELGVDDCVRFCGNRPNEEILSEMRKHKIFLFTSDRNEGWGAVLNEAMANGCIPVAADAIGSVPYLIKDGVNGMIFKSGELDSLELKVKKVIDDSILSRVLANNAIKTMREVWSPQNAASKFLKLLEYIISNNLRNYHDTEGPASWA